MTTPQAGDFEAYYGDRDGRTRGPRAQPVVRESGRATADGSGADAAVAQFISRQSGALALCGERQRRVMPGATGTLRFSWTIEPDGRVSNVKLRSPEFSSYAVATCVMELIKKWRFPANGTQVDVELPFRF